MGIAAAYRYVLSPSPTHNLKYLVCYPVVKLRWTWLVVRVLLIRSSADVNDVSQPGCDTDRWTLKAAGV